MAHHSNHGSMMSGITGETADGMSLEKIGAIINALRGERYRWAPVKRVNTPKKNGKKPPLDLPTWSDKVVAEVVRLPLEAYYDVQFSDHSHGFRPGRGCHTALDEVVRVWYGTHWFIEGDISDCFGSLDLSSTHIHLGAKGTGCQARGIPTLSTPVPARPAVWGKPISVNSIRRSSRTHGVNLRADHCGRSC